MLCLLPHQVAVLSSVVTFLLLAVPVLIPVATFGAYLALGNQLDAAKVNAECDVRCSGCCRA